MKHSTKATIGGILLILAIFLLGSLLKAQCTPTLTGDSMACPGHHTYFTDPGHTGYNWNVHGANFISTGDNWLELEWETMTGYVRVTYDGCDWNTIIVGECTTTGIKPIEPRSNVPDGVYDFFGRSIPQAPERGYYFVKKGNLTTKYVK